MSVRVKMGQETEFPDLNIQWEEDRMADAFRDNLSEEMLAWLRERNLEPDVWAEYLGCEFENGDGDLVARFEVGLDFENRDDAMLFKLTFGGV